MTADREQQSIEMVDIYDSNHVRTGIVLPREGVFKNISEDDRVLAVHMTVFNSRGEMIIQRRVLTKDRYPGRWDVSAGGFVTAGETSAEAGRRELAEELGIDIASEDIHFIACEPYMKVIDDFFLIHYDCGIDELKLQKEEVMDARWAGEDEILAMIKDGSFVDYSEVIIRKSFEAFSRLYPAERSI